MPLPVITDVYRCAFKWRHSDLSSDAVNVMHFRQTGTNPAALAADIDANVNNVLWNFEDTHAKITEIDITKLDGSSTTFPYVTGSGADYTGFSSSHDVIPQGAAIIKLVTAKRGRSYRGRLYLPWVAETFSTNGVLDATTVTNVTAAWVTFLADMASAGPQLVVASYLHSTAEDVIAILCEGMLATQRRRLHR